MVDIDYIYQSVEIDHTLVLFIDLSWFKITDFTYLYWEIHLLRSGVWGGQSHELKVSEYSKLNFLHFRNGYFTLTFQVVNWLFESTS